MTPVSARRGAISESAQALKLEGLRVLVVEDEALVAFQLEDMLADLGCAIIGPASRVGQALDLLVRQPVDAAVLDLNIGAAASWSTRRPTRWRAAGSLTYSLPATAPPA